MMMNGNYLHNAAGTNASAEVKQNGDFQVRVQRGSTRKLRSHNKNKEFLREGHTGPTKNMGSQNKNKESLRGVYTGPTEDLRSYNRSEGSADARGVKSADARGRKTRSGFLILRILLVAILCAIGCDGSGIGNTCPEINTVADVEKYLEVLKVRDMADKTQLDQKLIEQKYKMLVEKVISERGQGKCGRKRSDKLIKKIRRCEKKSKEKFRKKQTQEVTNCPAETKSTSAEKTGNTSAENTKNTPEKQTKSTTSAEQDGGTWELKDEAETVWSGWEDTNFTLDDYCGGYPMEEVNLPEPISICGQDGEAAAWINKLLSQIGRRDGEDYSISDDDGRKTDLISQWFQNLLTQTSEKLGVGSTCTVYKYEDQLGNERVTRAVKEIAQFQANGMDQQELGNIVAGEIGALERLSKNGANDLICNLQGAFVHDYKWYLVLDPAVTDLKKMKRSLGDDFNESVARHYSRRLFNALQFAHQSNTPHLDLKLENCLVDKFGKSMLSDFANSWEDELISEDLGSAGYKAPEILDNEDKSEETRSFYKTRPVDLWNTGFCVWEMLVGADADKNPFAPLQSTDIRCFANEIHTNIKNREWNHHLKRIDDAKISLDAKDLLRKLFERNPDERITIDQALKHPWFKGEMINDKQAQELVNKALANRSGRKNAKRIRRRLARAMGF